MKTVRKIVALNLALILLMCLIPLSVSAGIPGISGIDRTTSFGPGALNRTFTVTADYPDNYKFAIGTLMSNTGGSPAVLQIKDTSGTTVSYASYTQPNSNTVIYTYSLSEGEYTLEAMTNGPASGAAVLTLWPGTDSPSVVTMGTNNASWGTSRAQFSATPVGSTVTISAFPATGYVFDYWDITEGGVFISDTSLQTGATFTMPAGDVTVRANFIQSPANAVTVTRNNDAWGTASASVSSAVWGSTVNLTASPVTDYKFVRWELASGSGVTFANANSQNTTFVMPENAVEIRAVFERAYPVTVIRNNNSWGTATANHETAGLGTVVNLTATPTTGYRFVRWEIASGSGFTFNNSTSPTTYFTMPAVAVSVRAVFEAAQPITVTRNNNAWGTATASQESAAQGTRVNLTATPNSGYRFVRWEIVSGSGFAFNNVNSPTTYFNMPNTAVTVRAVFEPAQPINVTRNNNSWGTATASQNSAAYGTRVDLTATPNSGYRFVRWEVVAGGITLNNVNSPTTYFTMPNTAVSVRAVFEIGSSLTVSVNNTAQGSAKAEPANATPGTTVTLTATPNIGYRFVRWDVLTGDITVRTLNELTAAFTMPGRDVSVRAVFANANLSGLSPWAAEEVSRAIASGIVPLQLQTEYTQNTTRAEFCALAVMLYETARGMEITGRVYFSDTNDVNVEKAASIGVVNGIGVDNKFDPHGTLTREQAATMLARLASAIGKPLPAIPPSFNDSTGISIWASIAVGQVQAAKIMDGIGSNMFSPKGMYTREQSILTALRMFDYV